MKSIFKHFPVFFCFTTIFQVQLNAQNEQSHHFIGIYPSVTVEPYYNKGELDVGIVPFVFQRSVFRNIDLRIATICNLGIRNGGNEISHFGLETAFPISFKRKDVELNINKGLYVAPILCATSNILELHNNLGLWVEPGYHLLFENHFAMSFGLQIGGTYFAYTNGQKKWGNHFGVKIIIGKWF